MRCRGCEALLKAAAAPWTAMLVEGCGHSLGSESVSARFWNVETGERIAAVWGLTGKWSLILCQSKMPGQWPEAVSVAEAKRRLRSAPVL